MNTWELNELYDDWAWEDHFERMRILYPTKPNEQSNQNTNGTSNVIRREDSETSISSSG